jgi:hypothetical protein
VVLAVAGSTTCGRVLWCHRVPVFEWHRSPLTGSRCEIRWLSGRGKTLTFCVIPVFSRRLWKRVVTLAVTGNTISDRILRLQRMSVFKWHRLALTESRWYLRWLSRRANTPTFCVYPEFRVAVKEKCCDACANGEYYFLSRCLLSADANVLESPVAVERKSMGHTVAERSCKDADILCISCS